MRRSRRMSVHRSLLTPTALPPSSASDLTFWWSPTRAKSRAEHGDTSRSPPVRGRSEQSPASAGHSNGVSSSDPGSVRSSAPLLPVAGGYHPRAACADAASPKESWHGHSVARSHHGRAPKGGHWRAQAAAAIPDRTARVHDAFRSISRLAHHRTPFGSTSQDAALVHDGRGHLRRDRLGRRVAPPSRLVPQPAG